MERIEILGVQIDNITGDEALDRIRRMIVSGRPHQIITPAIEQVICARRDAEFNRVLAEADLVVPDGMQVIFASRLHKTPLKERITGVDLVPKICQLAAAEGHSVFFLGGEEGVADQTAHTLKYRFPELKIAGAYCPPYKFEENPEEEAKTIHAVQAAKPDVLFVAFGAPRQEKWIHRRKNDLRVPVMIGVGGAFNFIIGREKRAPQWIQNLGMEGLYRLFQRPRGLWKRIILNAPYFFLLLFDRLSYRTQKRIALLTRPLLLGIVDAILAPMLFLFSYWLYFRSGLFANTEDPFPTISSLLDMPAYSDLLIFVSLLAVPAMWINRLYERDKYLTLDLLSARIVKASITAVLLLIAFQFVFKEIFKEYLRGYSRVVFGFYGLVFMIVLFVWRWLFYQFEHLLHRRRIILDRIVIVGTNRTAMEIGAAMKQHPEIGFDPLGFISTSGNDTAPAGEIPPLGNLSDLERLLPARKVDEVLIADPAIALDDLYSIVNLCRKNRLRLSIVPTIHELLGVHSEIKRLGNYRVITVKPDRDVQTAISTVRERR
ncbi:MAG: WecB/TagA/CpsF family glycosyltransferase [Candidatus Omnitrophota bacterium]|jgi:exopolysaccharide biosynthesis WecB/TagA/CpsF family protein|nr:MAG: WecB/TagA/CpsF family glycosyltransferase [Candidatus Omnitrophota bacterium]